MMHTIAVPMIYSPLVAVLFGIVLVVALVRGVIRLVSAFVVG